MRLLNVIVANHSEKSLKAIRKKFIKGQKCGPVLESWPGFVPTHTVSLQIEIVCGHLSKR